MTVVASKTTDTRHGESQENRSVINKGNDSGEQKEIYTDRKGSYRVEETGVVQ